MQRKPRHNDNTGMFTRQLDYDKIAYLYYEKHLSYSEISHKMNCSSTAIAYALKAMDRKEKNANNKKR